MAIVSTKTSFLYPLTHPEKAFKLVINQLAADDPKLKTAVAENFFDSSLLEEIKSK